MGLFSHGVCDIFGFRARGTVYPGWTGKALVYPRSADPQGNYSEYEKQKCAHDLLLIANLEKVGEYQRI
jgi:hypothetical protein